jgi:hypothetical protein
MKILRAKNANLWLNVNMPRNKKERRQKERRGLKLNREEK